LNEPDFPVTIDYALTGASGITVGEVLNAENAISEDTTDYASLVNVAGIAGSTFITIEEQITDYPAGTFAGFDIQNLSVAGIGILNNLTVTTYLDDVQQESVSGSNLLVGGALFNDTGRQTVGFGTTEDFDKVRLTVSQPIGLNLGTTRVYSAILQEFCAGPPLECNEFTAITNPEYPVYIDGARTGFTGVACVLCEIEDAGHVIDADPDNYAEIDITAGVTTIGSLAVKDQLTDYDAGTFAGFHIENPSLVNANVLTGITISTYLDGSLQESETNLGSLITVGSGLLVGAGEQYVGFVTTEPFDEVQISLANIVGTFDIGTTRIYSAVFEEFCAVDIMCDTTYYWTNPDFPVYVDAFLTGPDGVACVGCEVNDEQNVLTADTSDYATISIVANVAGFASLAVADALYTYPAGTFAGYVIDDLGFLLEAELFETLVISTYLDGELQEFRTGDDLIDLAVLILFISADEGRYNVGFEATLPFDEIRISVGSLATAVNLVRVYAAFVDTRASDGGPLMCIDGPMAVDDIAETDEDTPVNIDVLSNDTDDESPLDSPTVDDEPSHGAATVNADSTITYSPDPDFVGLDSFTYFICNDDEPPLCDTALVIVTVYPVTDTIEEAIPEDSMITVCANDLTEYNEPATSIALCGNPSDGDAQVNGDCITYTPDPGFNGNDTMCVVSCHPDIPSLCDTTIVVITVTPVNEAPVAVDDDAITNEDTPVNIDVLENDSDPDSPLGIPAIDDPPAHGDVVVNSDSTITYTPDPDFVGVDSFTYFICDDGMPVLCDTATVIINVVPVIDTVEVTIPEDSLVTYCANELTIFTDPATSIAVCDMPANGTLTVEDDCITYVPDEDYHGQDTFCVYSCHPDDNTLCDTTIVIVTITPVNDAPNAIDDADTTDQNVPVTVDVLENDSDPDSPLGFPTIADNPSNGSLVVNLDSTITYTPDMDFVGQDTFSYSICDAGMPVMCDTAMVVITVFPGRDTIIEQIPQDSTWEMCFSELTEIQDPDSMDVCGMPDNGTLMIIDTCIQYVPDPDFEGADTMCIVVCDSLFCDTTIVVIIIQCPDIIVKVLLEGPYDSGSGLMTTTLNEFHVLPGQDPTQSSNPGAQILGMAAPPGQPYNIAPWNWMGDEGDSYGDGSGDRVYDATVTDWILVSVRENDSLPTSEVWKCAGLLYNDGTVVFPPECDCGNAIDTVNSYYIVVEHRNHLPVMSTLIQLENGELNFDFTQNQSWIFSLGGMPIGEGQKLIGSTYVMHAANSEQLSARIDINASDDAVWLMENSTIFQYKAADHNLDGDVNATDEFIWIINNSTFTLLPF
jgi:hypothetical protein